MATNMQMIKTAIKNAMTEAKITDPEMRKKIGTLVEKRIESDGIEMKMQYIMTLTTLLITAVCQEIVVDDMFEKLTTFDGKLGPLLATLIAAAVAKFPLDLIRKIIENPFVCEKEKRMLILQNAGTLLERQNKKLDLTPDTTYIFVVLQMFYFGHRDHTKDHRGQNDGQRKREETCAALFKISNGTRKRFCDQANLFLFKTTGVPVNKNADLAQQEKRQSQQKEEIARMHIYMQHRMATDNDDFSSLGVFAPLNATGVCCHHVSSNKVDLSELIRR
jgi:hypothetical protein